MRGHVHEFQELGAADHFGDGPEAELGHDFAEFFGDEEHVVDDVLGLALEFFAELGVLRGDANGAGVEVADAHHDAAGSDEGSGGEADFFSAEQHGDGDVAAGFDLAVGLEDDAAAEVVHHQDLLGFGQAEFPGDAGVFDGGEWRSAGAAAVAGNQNVIGLGFGDAGGDGADADFTHEFHGDARLRIGVFQIVNELREVFDGVDVVMRRRGGEADAGGGVADFSDGSRDLV